MAQRKASKQPRRLSVRRHLDGEAKRTLDDMARRPGMAQTAVLARLVRWFAGQDEVVQASVLHTLGQEHLGDVSEMMLRRLTAARGG
jgi:hypothetical protein